MHTAQLPSLSIHEHTVIDRLQRLVDLAQSIVDERPTFTATKGPGQGDRDTNEFMGTLRRRAHEDFGIDIAEQQICGDNGLCVDFYFREEEAVVEVALSLRNPLSEFERDILKAIMAKEANHPVQRLLFLSKPGAIRRCAQPGARAIAAWAERAHGLTVEVRELQSRRTSS